MRGMLPESFYNVTTAAILGTSYCPNTGVPSYECMCDDCLPTDERPITMPSIPAAVPMYAAPTLPPEPEVCKYDYYGIECNNPTCPSKHQRRRW